MSSRRVMVRWLGVFKPLYHRLPAGFRHAAVVTRFRDRLAPHDMLYSAEYFGMLQASAAASAPRIADSIVRDFQPASAIDVGCGSGELLLALHARKVEVVGLEYASAAVEQCRSRGLSVTRFDLEHETLDVVTEYNVAISMEVAEHLPAQLADRFVNLLTHLAPVVVFTAAVPGQGGIDHVNEQPRTYWIERFTARGFDYDTARSAKWTANWQSTGQVAKWYWRNLMIFRKRDE